MAYDALGRMTDRTTLEPDDTTVSSSAAWEFENELDVAAPTGALKSSTATTVIDATTTFVTVQATDTWDTLGRPTATTTHLPQDTVSTDPAYVTDASSLGELAGTDYTRTVTYDELSRPTVTLPAIAGLPAQTIVNGYNRFGTPVTEPPWVLFRSLFERIGSCQRDIQRSSRPARSGSLTKRSARQVPAKRMPCRGLLPVWGCQRSLLDGGVARLVLIRASSGA